MVNRCLCLCRLRTLRGRLRHGSHFDDEVCRYGDRKVRWKITGFTRLNSVKGRVYHAVINSYYAIMSDSREYELSKEVKDIRRECRQFAMLYYHLCKVLVEELGIHTAKEKVQKILYSLSIDRTNQLRKRAEKLKLPCTLDTFNEINDLPTNGWVEELGKCHCPYAECWVTYYEQSPWFREFAPLYCNVIDTTNIENFTKKLTHKLTKNVLTGDDTCERIYVESDNVKSGKFTYTI